MINSTSYGLANTASFRRASKMIFGRYGSNLQNPSKRTMEIYHPLEGNIFIQPDQAGAEALVVSKLTSKGKFRELFENGIKSHTYVASHIFKEKWRKAGFKEIDIINTLDIINLRKSETWAKLSNLIKHSDDEYFIGKKVCHQSNYRATSTTVREDILKESEGKLALTPEQGDLFHSTYHRIFPEISLEWWLEIEYQVRKFGYLFNLFGFPFYCVGPYTPKFWREVTAWVPQSTVGCITAIAFCWMQEYIEDHNLQKEWHLRNEKHDSLLLECPEKHKDDAIPVLRASIESQELKTPRGEIFRMGCGISVGYNNWAKKSESNPNGMEEISA